MEDILFLAIGAGVGIAVLLALGLLLAIGRQTRGRRLPDAGRLNSVLLMRNGRVVDHSPDLVTLLDRPSLIGLDWEPLREAFSAGFPDLPARAPDSHRVWHCALLDECTLTAEPLADGLRLTLSCVPDGAAAVFRAAALLPEFDRLSDIALRAPEPVWEMDEDGAVIWHNEAYAELCRDAGQDRPEVCPFALPLPEHGTARSTRVSLRRQGGTQVSWFEISSRPISCGWMHYAKSIDSLVNAEMAQRNFVQTLTKTFAHLPIGLAVFDRDRQLVLFNPALLDLTHLPVDFLSAKPNLLSFFDHMRESRMMPEPKNYTSWRGKLYDVVSAAREDRYCETWNLPSGLTYKITGRPHPDGAVAFLIEDISAEISLTRRFRSELELTQSVLDCFPEGVAVFSRLGVLTFSNAAYRAQWKCDPDSAFAEVTIVDATRDWQEKCQPSPIWQEIREFVLVLRERSAWDSDITLTDGTRLVCTVEPVAAGATMVRFTHPARPAEALPLLRSSSGG